MVYNKKIMWGKKERPLSAEVYESTRTTWQAAFAHDYSIVEHPNTPVRHFFEAPNQLHNGQRQYNLTQFPEGMSVEEFIAKLKEVIPFYEARLLIKPGITGWAQINFPYGASEKDAMEKLQYDLYYVKNRSLVLDLSILLKTIKTVLSGGGQ